MQHRSAHHQQAHQPALAASSDVGLASFSSVAVSAAQLPCFLLAAAKQHCRDCWAADGPRLGVSGTNVSCKSISSSVQHAAGLHLHTYVPLMLWGLVCAGRTAAAGEPISQRAANF